MNKTVTRTIQPAALAVAVASALMVVPACADTDVMAKTSVSAFSSYEFPADDYARERLVELASEGAAVSFHSKRVTKLTRDFYKARQDRLAWSEDGRVSEAYEGLIGAIQDSRRHGLLPSEYPVEKLRAAAERAIASGKAEYAQRAEWLAEFDVLATQTFFTYALDLLQGRYSPDEIDPLLRADVDVKPRERDLVALLNDTLSGGDLDEIARHIAPQHPQYQALGEALLALYEQMGQAPEPVNIDGVLNPGETHPAIPALRARLGLAISESEVYDDDLVRAVEKVQGSAGLKVDGVIGPQTMAFINIDPAQQIETVRANMDRWRWLPDDLGERYFMVNIPEYEVGFFERGSEFPEWDMRVVVGTQQNPTPLFSDEMEYVVLRPYWNVPYSIATKEILPKVKQHGVQFLLQDHYEVLNSNGDVIDPYSVNWQALHAGNFNVRLRQKAGDHNALGLVKFLFPNQHNVYMHDTPLDSLFEREQRAFSHGCIRLHKPDEFAYRIIGDQTGWDLQTIRDKMHHGQQQWLTLNEALPVHVVYFSAYVDEYGQLQLREDIYGLDQAADKVLASNGRARSTLPDSLVAASAEPLPEPASIQ